jgi:hypothetical protein
MLGVLATAPFLYFSVTKGGAMFRMPTAVANQCLNKKVLWSSSTLKQIPAQHSITSDRDRNFRYIAGGGITTSCCL